MSLQPAKRRQRHGSAWYWKQTDAWYYTLRGTKRRVPLLDGEGKRIRGSANRQAAQLALARVRLEQGLAPATDEAIKLAAQAAVWTVARVCSEYIMHCARAVAAGRMRVEYHKGTVYYLNALCSYCGAISTAELKRGDVAAWVESRSTWRSPVTRRDVMTIILAAFNHAGREHGLHNPLKGLKKPNHRPRLQSITPEEEQTIYGATDEAFRNFLFAAIHTGLRPFCELAKLKAEHVDETPRGMMWRVYSSKTKKTRKIPVRPDVATLARRLLKTAPAGSGLPLFRNVLGTAWKRVTGVGRFLTIKRKLGWVGDDTRARYSCYTCRHTFAHRMLSGYWNQGRGCSIEVLAELMGNTPKVAFDHYGKEWAQHYQDPLWAAIGERAVPHTKQKTGRGARGARLGQASTQRHHP